MTALQVYGLVIIVATFCASLVFVILYGLYASWYRSRLGRHLMWFSIVVTVTYLNSVVRTFFPDLPYKVETTYVIITLVFLVVLQRTWIFIRVMIKDRKDLKEARRNEPERQGS